VVLLPTISILFYSLPQPQQNIHPSLPTNLPPYLRYLRRRLRCLTPSLPVPPAQTQTPHLISTNRSHGQLHFQVVCNNLSFDDGDDRDDSFKQASPLSFTLGAAHVACLRRGTSR
jgi:hypothetical protein